MVKLADETLAQQKKATRAAYGVTLVELADEGVECVLADNRLFHFVAFRVWQFYRDLDLGYRRITTQQVVHLLQLAALLGHALRCL